MNFLNPWMFAGLAAASVPILLHLIKRERSRRIDFPSLLYLRRISKRTIRYQKIRHLLLLLLRVAAFVLLALAFTRPFRDVPRAIAAAGRQTNAHVILLDNSLSMSYRDRWDRARKAAEEIVRRAQPGDRVSLLEFSDSVLTRVQPTEDAAAVLAQLRADVALSDRPTRYGQALKAAERIALEIGTERRTIHLISDFQRTGLGADEASFRLGPSIALEYVDVGSNDYSNLAFGDVQVRDSDDVAGGSLKIKASVVNFGTEDRKSVGVSLLLDGRGTQNTRVDVAKGGVHGIEFELPGLTAGSHTLALEVEDANLTRDNRFLMVVETRGKTPVISIEAQGSGRLGRSPSYFLGHALNISALSPYRLQVTQPQRLEAPPASGIVVWNNAPPGPAHAKLHDYVRAGGGVIVALGDQVRAADFNRTFGTWIPVEMEGARVEGGSTRGAADYALLTDVRMDHPVFRPFNEPHSGSFATARFFGHERLKPGPTAEVLARFDNGDPALVAATVDRGRVLVWASSADDSWNDLPIRAVYAPFWQQMLRYLDNYQEGRRWVEVGETLAPQKLMQEAALRQGKLFDSNLAVAVLDPAHKRVPLAPGSTAVLVDSAGLYEVRTSAAVATVASNTVPRESDLAHVNAEEVIAGWVSPDAAGAGARAIDERLSEEEQERKQGFWRLLLLAVLVFFVAEGVLANRLVLKPE